MGTPLLSVPELFGSTLLTWTLIGLGLYWAGLIVLRRLALLPDWVGVQGPMVTMHTTRGREFLDWLSGPKRFWRAWANFGIGISLVVMVAMFIFLLGAAISSIVAPQPTDIQQPQNVLVIPGVNDFLPLSAAPGIVIGLFVGLVVHEGGHGLLCRVEDIDIESMGVAMVAILPIGAFVQPDEESSRDASRGGQTRMFAAGVTNNFVVTIVGFALLFWLVGSAIAVAPGAAVGGVVAGSPAEEAGIGENDRITHLDGEPIEDNDHFADVLDANDAGTITVTIDGEREVPVDRAPIVVSALDGGPAGLELRDRILEVDGESVSTGSQVTDAVGDDERVTLAVEATDGTVSEHEDVPIGASVQVLEGSALESAGAPVDSFFVVTVADGERTHDGATLSAVLADRAGETITLEGYVDDERVSYEVTADPDATQFDAAVHSGVTAMEINDLGVQLYPAEAFHSLLGGSGDQPFGSVADTFFGQILFALLLPIIGLLGLQFNFAGFAGGIENFYEVQGLLSPLGEPLVFALANVLFWTAWINLNLGFFNCIPAFPLDGGHILRTSTEAIISRIPGVEATRRRVRVVTTLVGVTMLASFILMVFGPTVLA
ncbi:site-2 protease family protein [Halovivax gelatinilyticus]|uniref:site-2 protease family protein n=1 Tax=Halovivax gelatinilyticus TaxID=2961597 RepID=UPI0020CA794F|nr:site-2 protease family protein [Halovivax gelatinilyticus]